jgi:hypothetical protein
VGEDVLTAESKDILLGIVTNQNDNGEILITNRIIEDSSQGIIINSEFIDLIIIITNNRISNILTIK